MADWPEPEPPSAPRSMFSKCGILYTADFTTLPSNFGNGILHSAWGRLVTIARVGKRHSCSLIIACAHVVARRGQETFVPAYLCHKENELVLPSTWLGLSDAWQGFPETTLAWIFKWFYFTTTFRSEFLLMNYSRKSSDDLPQLSNQNRHVFIEDVLYP